MLSAMEPASMRIERAVLLAKTCWAFEHAQCAAGENKLLTEASDRHGACALLCLSPGDVTIVLPRAA